jgi:hypothetical protein
LAGAYQVPCNFDVGLAGRRTPDGWLCIRITAAEASITDSRKAKLTDHAVPIFASNEDSLFLGQTLPATFRSEGRIWIEFFQAFPLIGTRNFRK